MSALNALETALKKVHGALLKNGLFLFDISSRRKFYEKIANTVSADDREDVTYLSFNSLKGDEVTMDVTLPGRYLVLTPHQSFVGVSKNIEDSEARHKLNEVMQELAEKHLNGMGCIVRTEAEEATKEELEREVKYLYRQWQSILKKI